MSEQNSAARDVVRAPRGFKFKLATAGLIIALSCAAAAIFSGSAIARPWHFVPASPFFNGHSGEPWLLL